MIRACVSGSPRRGCAWSAARSARTSTPRPKAISWLRSAGRGAPRSRRFRCRPGTAPMSRASTPIEGTYAYCVVAAVRRPRRSHVAHGPAGLGPVRLLDVAQGLYLAVADAPLNQYGETAIRHVLSDLEQVSRAALAH